MENKAYVLRKSFAGSGQSPLEEVPDSQGLWVFGYGSLMWDPGFLFSRSYPAVLIGYHRRFSVYSNGSYGCPTSPGLALGLHRGGSCRALIFQIAAKNEENTLAYLDRRESAYLRKKVKVSVGKGGFIEAITYIVNPQHPRYAGFLHKRETARLILNGTGSKGSSLGYLEKTVSELERQGMLKSNMHDLLDTVRAFAASAET